jgi:hypothetical protein
MYRMKIRQLAVGAFLAAVMVWGAETHLSAALCQKQCSCKNLLCGGDGCSCSAFNGTWWDCGFLDTEGGCSWDCGGNEGITCCSEVCPAG